MNSVSAGISSQAKRRGFVFQPEIYGDRNGAQDYRPLGVGNIEEEFMTVFKTLGIEGTQNGMYSDALTMWPLAKTNGESINKTAFKYCLTQPTKDYYTPTTKNRMEKSPRIIGENHAEITKLRVKDFFNEIRDLLMIDNAYRGFYNVDHYAREANDRHTANCTEMTNMMRVFFQDLTLLVKEDNSYRGINCTTEKEGL